MNLVINKGNLTVEGDDSVAKAIKLVGQLMDQSPEGGGCEHVEITNIGFDKVIVAFDATMPVNLKKLEGFCK